MTSQRDEHDASAFERQARAAFEESAAQLDGATLSRLNQSRQRALEAARGRPASPQRWFGWAPVGAAAAAVLVAVLVLRPPHPTGTAAPVAANGAADAAIDPLTMVAAGDDLELAAEADLDFYAWVELETAGDGVT